MKHVVRFTLPMRTLGREDVVFQIIEDGVKLGELWVSKGGIEWRRAYGKKTRRLRWSTFVNLIEGDRR
jgi:hypothetical protein